MYNRFVQNAQMQLAICLSALTSVSCALGPTDFEYPPLLSIEGEVSKLSSTFGDDTEVSAVLSWYVFRVNAANPVPWQVATQMQLVSDTDENKSFQLSILQAPPEAAFVSETENPVFSSLQGKGKMAIGFLAFVLNDDEKFNWTIDYNKDTSWPINSYLILWWDGEEVDGSLLGISRGTLQPGLNVLKVNVDQSDYPLSYELLDDRQTIPLIELSVNFRAVPTACGLTLNVEPYTYLPTEVGYSPNPATLFDFDPEDFYDVVQCSEYGRYYRLPESCWEVFHVLCRNCRRYTVHVNPENTPDDWACLPTAYHCKQQRENGRDICVLRNRYICNEDNQPLLAETCTDSDYGCNENCTPAFTDGP